MATTRARSKPPQEFKDLFRIVATKEEIQSDVLKMIEDLQKMAETSEKKPDVQQYEPFLKVADAIRAEAEESPGSRRTRKRKRAMDVEKKPTQRRRMAARVAFPAGQPTCSKDVCVRS